MMQTYCDQIVELVDRRLRQVRESGGTEWNAANCRKELLHENKLTQNWERAAAAGESLPLEYLLRIFRLSRFQRHCVYLALALEISADFEARYAAMQESRQCLPSLALCIDSFPAPAGERMELLRQWKKDQRVLSFFFSGITEGNSGGSDLSFGLKLERRVVSFLFDVMSKDPILEGKSWIHWPGQVRNDSFVCTGELPEKMARCSAECGKQNLLFYLKGERGSGRRTLARQLCGSEGRPLLEVDLPELISSVSEAEEALIPLCRETAIRGAALMLTGLEKLMKTDAHLPTREEEGGKTEKTDWTPTLHMLLDWTAQVTDRLILLSESDWNPRVNPGVWQKTELQLEVPDIEGRVELWRCYLKEIPLAEDLNLESAANKFALYPGQIASAAEEAKNLMRWDGADAVSTEILQRACRAQLSHGLGRMASRVNASYTWDDLILPPDSKRMLRNACAQVEYRHRVFDQWGFGKKVAYGRGVSMLFSGPPGTGKTMAAQVIANRLGLELYKVDLSGVMSKYVGETEKQLGAVFDEVKKSQSILFFDEADAMFGKRSETKDSHDRYANVQTSYLLQKMEEYDGIVILASNYLQNFDEAFKRRLKFIIEFTLPDREHREQIWRSVLPPDLPLGEDLDFDFLARSFELSGSSIKNIAVAAAFLAAQEDVPMEMVHLLAATQTEYSKTGKSIAQEELGEYYHQVRDYQTMKTVRS